MKLTPDNVREALARAEDPPVEIDAADLMRLYDALQAASLAAQRAMDVSLEIGGDMPTQLLRMELNRGAGYFRAAADSIHRLFRARNTAAQKERAVSELPPVLDACCGSRMMWFYPNNPLGMFVDKRREDHVLCDGRALSIAPDVLANFTALPFPDESFHLVVFDPPHFKTLGATSWLAKKYGRLIADWETEIRGGFDECWRVLKTNGTLIFKWNSTEIPLASVLAIAPSKPLFGHTVGRQAKTHWMTFLKQQ